MQTIIFLIFGRSELFITALGFVALGLESTLPIPQFIRSVFRTQLNDLVSTDVGTAITSRNLYMDSARPLCWAGSVVILTSLSPFCLISCTTTQSKSSCRVVYFFLQQSPLQFKVCAIFQLSIDCGA